MMWLDNWTELIFEARRAILNQQRIMFAIEVLEKCIAMVSFKHFVEH